MVVYWAGTETWHIKMSLSKVGKKLFRPEWSETAPKKKKKKDFFFFAPFNWFIFKCISLGNISNKANVIGKNAMGKNDNVKIRNNNSSDNTTLVSSFFSHLYFHY